MKMDLQAYAGRCKCGREHRLETQCVWIESGATSHLKEAVHLAGGGRGAIVCDTNTHPFAQAATKHLHGSLLETPVIALHAEGLHADEKATAALDTALPADAQWLIAAGSGTVHDTTRYIASQRQVPFLSYPTAATVDGFVSSVSAMTWHGFKKTLPGVAPVAVIADTDIFGNAPYYLTAAGIGDVLGKYTSLLDWKIAHLVSGEPYCEHIAQITREAADRVRAKLPDIRNGKQDAMEDLMYALLLSGLAMQLWGNSRPASGSEHHISHLWEMEVLNGHIDALHGEKVGVALCLLLQVYTQVAQNENLRVAPVYKGIDHARLRHIFGGLYDEIAKENSPDPLEQCPTGQLQEKMPEICALVRQLPGFEQIRNEMRSAGCHTTPGDIGINNALIEDTLLFSPYVRNRLTLARLLHLFIK